jgi:F420-dependent methylenetetrahydromethanopterin dehydrogenase
MFDWIGKRVFITALGMVAALLGSKFLDPVQAASFQDFVIKALAAFVAGQTASDSVEAWAAKSK